MDCAKNKQICELGHVFLDSDMAGVAVKTIEITQ